MSERHRHVEVLLFQVPAANTAELHTERGNGCLLNITVSNTHNPPFSSVKGYGVFFFKFLTDHNVMKEKGGFIGID